MTFTTLLSPPPEANLTIAQVNMLGLRASTTAHERGKLQCSEKIKVTEESSSGARNENFHAVLSFMWALAVLLYRNKCLLRIVHLLWDSETQGKTGS